MSSPAYATPLAEDLSPVHDDQPYADGEALGALMTLIPKTPISSGPRGPLFLVEELVLSIPEALTPNVDLVLFDTIPTAIADHDAWDPTADVEKIADVIEIRAANWKVFDSTRVAIAPALVRTFRNKTPPNLYAVFIARAAVTFTTENTLKGKISGFIN